MSLLLINPPLLFKAGCRRPSISIPLGLLYLLASLKDKVQLSFLDFLGQGNVSSDDFPKPQADISKSDLWLGLSPDEIEKKLSQMPIPDFVGINLSFITHSLTPVLEIAKIIKKLKPKARVIVGGSGVISGLLEKYPDIDIVFFGEGEERFLDLLGQKDLSKIRGIEFRQGQRIITTLRQSFIKDLDTLAFPDYSRIDVEKYFSFNSLGMESRYSYDPRSLSFITSRGCPFDCSFCMIGYVMGSQLRIHSPDYVRRHIELLKDRYDVRHLHIEDDNISLDLERFDKLLDIFKNQAISWDPSNGIMVNNFDKAIVKKIKDSGCKSLRVAPESGSQRVIDQVIGKKVSLGQIKKVIRWAHECDLDVIGYLVIGFPGETSQDLKETLEFAQSYRDKYKVSWSVCMANPIVGTRLRKYCLDNGLLLDKELSQSMGAGYKSRYLIRHPEFSEDFLLACIKKMQPVFS